MRRQALTPDKIKEFLGESGYICPPWNYALPTIEENAYALWTDINAQSGGKNEDEVPDHPIRLLFQKKKDEWDHEDLVLAYVRELTTEEAKMSKAMSRQPDEKKTYGPWPKHE
jgi:hypothetical protein